MGHGPVVDHDAVFSGPQSFSTINSKLRETWCFSLNVNGPTPFLTNLVGHEQKKVGTPWLRPNITFSCPMSVLEALGTRTIHYMQRTFLHLCVQGLAQYIQ